jgi:hypothetical protein
MTKSARSEAGARAELPASGIFGPEWFKWRGATLAVTLRDEPLAFTRLDDVREAGDHCAATLTELDAPREAGSGARAGVAARG